jgi:hypothetical protein
MNFYLGAKDADIEAAIRAHAKANDRPISWATRDLLRKGMSLVQVPVVGDIRQEYERRKDGES